MNHYEWLQVDRRASMDVIKAAHRVRLKTQGNHPDLGGDEELAKAINEAYRVLSDPALRAEYDKTLVATTWPGGERRTMWTPFGQAPPPERVVERQTLYIMFCPACGKQNRIRDEKMLERAKCGFCHRRLWRTPQGKPESEAEHTFRLGMYLFEKGLMERAVKEFHQATRLEPKQPNHHYWLARAHYERNQYDKALAALKTAFALKPKSFQFLFWLGQVMFAQKDYRHAAEYFNQALSLRADYTLAWRRLGACHYHLTEYEHAAHAFSRATQTDPSDARNHRWWGLALMAGHQPDQALPHFVEAQRLDPQDEHVSRYILACQKEAKSIPSGKAGHLPHNN